MHSKENKPHSLNSSFSLIGDVLHYNKSTKTIKLSKDQVKLIDCLLHGYSGKEDVINFIWGDSDITKYTSRYNKLISRTRSKLIIAGFPRDTILTISNVGVFINNSPTQTLEKLSNNNIEFDIDSRVIHAFHM